MREKSVKLKDLFAMKLKKVRRNGLYTDQDILNTLESDDQRYSFVIKILVKDVIENGTLKPSWYYKNLATESVLREYYKKPIS